MSGPEGMGQQPQPTLAGDDVGAVERIPAQPHGRALDEYPQPSGLDTTSARLTPTTLLHLVEAGLNADDLNVIVEAPHPAELLKYKLDSEQQGARFTGIALVGAVVAFAVGDFTILTTANGSLHTTPEIFGLSACGAATLTCGLAARYYLAKANRVMSTAVRALTILQRART